MTIAEAKREVEDRIRRVLTTAGAPSNSVDLFLQEVRKNECHDLYEESETTDDDLVREYQCEMRDSNVGTMKWMIECDVCHHLVKEIDATYGKFAPLSSPGPVCKNCALAAGIRFVELVDNEFIFRRRNRVPKRR